MPLRRLIRDRRGAVATIVALASPALLASIGFGVDWGLVQANRSALQTAADATAAAGREVLDPFSQIDTQPRVLDTTQRYAKTLNIVSEGATAKVDMGWYDPSTHKFGPPQTSQNDGTLFANALQVTMSIDHKLVFGPFLGLDTITLARRSIAYKCSNSDYPIARVADDLVPPPPDKPAIYLSYGTPKDPTVRGWVYKNPSTGRWNPAYKFWSPTDKEDVSFVVTLSDGTLLQVDTYCRGTYLVVPDAFDVHGYVNSRRVISADVNRGSTNNSFDIFPDQSKYPLDNRHISVDYAVPVGDLLDLYGVYKLKPADLRTITYPCGNPSSCPQQWIANASPSPERRTTLVEDVRNLF